MADQQEALERLRELYREKNEHLEKFLEPVEPYEFYREIFPEGSFERKGHFEDRKGNGIAVTVPKGEVDKATGIALQIEGDGKAKRCTITDELDELRELQDTDFTIMSPISYFGRRRCGKNARYPPRRRGGHGEQTDADGRGQNVENGFFPGKMLLFHIGCLL